jgi:hypothetical protein
MFLQTQMRKGFQRVEESLDDIALDSLLVKSAFFTRERVSLGLMTMFLEFHVFADSDEEGFQRVEESLDYIALDSPLVSLCHMRKG